MPAQVTLTPGTFTKDKFGYSLPLDAPLYGAMPPLTYTDATILLLPYFTDVARAAALVPPPLQVVTVGPYAIAEVVFARYPASGIGAYNEVAQTIAVVAPGVTAANGQPTSGLYPVRLHVTTDIAMAAGREIGGFPKKIGPIAFTDGPQYVSSLGADDGSVICSGQVMAGDPLPLTQLPLNYFSLRVMPSLGGGVTGQLIHSVWVLEGQFRVGKGTLTLNQSASDPYASLPVSPTPIPPPQAGSTLPFTGVFSGTMNVQSLAVVQTI
jgi:acetoacetate decarboxylase